MDLFHRDQPLKQELIAKVAPGLFRDMIAEGTITPHEPATFRDDLARYLNMLKPQEQPTRVKPVAARPDWRPRR